MVGRRLQCPQSNTIPPAHSPRAAICTRPMTFPPPPLSLWVSFRRLLRHTVRFFLLFEVITSAHCLASC